MPSYDWAPPPPPTLFLSASCFLFLSLPVCRRSRLLTGEGGVEAWFRIRILVNLSCWIRIQKCKMTHKNRKKYRNFMFEVLDVLFLELKPIHVAYASFMEAWGTSKLQFFQKNVNFFFSG